jgi:hypothetical protein
LYKNWFANYIDTFVAVDDNGWTFGTTIGSQRVLEKFGFSLEGRFEKTIWKKDRFEDELIYAIRRT